MIPYHAQIAGKLVWGLTQPTLRRQYWQLIIKTTQRAYEGHELAIAVRLGIANIARKLLAARSGNQ